MSNPSTPVPDLLLRIERWFQAHRPDYELAKSASRAKLAALERALGRPVPEGVRSLLAWHDGEKTGRVGRFHESWSLMDARSIGATVKTLNELTASGDLEPGWWHPTWVPFLENGGGDHLCVDSASGEVVEWFHDDDRRTALAPSLAAWLEVFATTLEADAWELEESGFFAGDSAALARARKTLAKGYPKKRRAEERPKKAKAPEDAGAPATGKVDRAAATRLLAAWGKWIHVALPLPKKAPFVVLHPKRWVEGGFPSVFEHDPERGVLVVRFHGGTYPQKHVDDVVRAVVARETSSALAKAKARLEVESPIASFGAGEARIVARRDFTDPDLPDAKFVDALKLLNKAAGGWGRARFFDFPAAIEKARKR